jgi:6-phosphogluconolactonase
MIQTFNEKTTEDAYQKAAEKIEGSINRLLKTHGTINLAVPGGRSVAGIFNYLKNKEIDWQKIHIFMIDERLVEITDSESNFLLVQKHLTDELIKKGKMSQENLHPFILDETESDHGIINYENEIKRQGAKYDIILLSSGEDGHVGGLYPNHHSIKNNSNFYLAFNDSPKPPKYRMSSSRKLLLSADSAVLLFLGEGKKEAFEKFKNDSLELFECPAKIVNYIENSFVITQFK